MNKIQLICIICPPLLMLMVINIIDYLVFDELLTCPTFQLFIMLVSGAVGGLVALEYRETGS